MKTTVMRLFESLGDSQKAKIVKDIWKSYVSSSFFANMRMSGDEMLIAMQAKIIEAGYKLEFSGNGMTVSNWDEEYSYGTASIKHGTEAAFVFVFVESDQIKKMRKMNVGVSDNLKITDASASGFTNRRHSRAGDSISTNINGNNNTVSINNREEGDRNDGFFTGMMVGSILSDSDSSSSSSNGYSSNCCSESSSGYSSSYGDSSSSSSSFD